MQSLFNEIKNPLFRTMCQIVNEIHAGKNLTRKEIKKRIFEISEFIYSEAPDFEREEKMIDMLFKFDKKTGVAEICLDAPLSISFTDAEIIWLKTMLQDDAASFLFPKNLREKLLERLQKFPALYEKNFWRKLTFKPSKPRAGIIFSEKLSLLLQALIEQKIISCAGKKIIPYRLEYDIFSDKYSLITWSAEKSCIEKFAVADLPEIILIAEKIPPDIESTVKNFYEENAVKVSLLIKNMRNAVERCFALFGVYDKEARLQADGNYILTITYLKFDEAEILEKILSLGAAVTVQSPAALRKKIRSIFIELQKIYREQ